MKQDLTPVFNYIRDNNQLGAREYRVAEMLAPQVGIVPPTDMPLFYGQEYVDTATGKKYYAKAMVVDAGAANWAEYAVVV